MAEYIGSRISLISKRDIRYVGILHEINSESSTVALEQVKSFGTEGRSEEEVPATDHVYEYIVFRGSDVKDLRIEKEPEKKAPQAQVPDDPAILGDARPMGAPPQSQANQQSPPQGPPSQPAPFNQQSPPQGLPSQPAPFNQQGRGQPPRFPQLSPYPYGGYAFPLNQRFGPYRVPHGFPPQGYLGPQFGPPPGWYPPPGQGFPPGPPGHMIPPHMQQGFPGQTPNHHGSPSKPATPAEHITDNAQAPPQHPLPMEKSAVNVKLPNPGATSPQPALNGPPPPTESKPDVAAALAPPAQAVPDPLAAKAASTTSKSGRIQPAIPMLSPASKPKVPINGTGQTDAATSSASMAVPAAVKADAARPAQVPIKSLEDANRDARAAVAAAMAKLPPGAGQQTKQPNEGGVTDNLTSKVNEMRVNDHARGPRDTGTGRYATGRHGSRGGLPGGRPRTESQTKKLEVPKTDYDFESANAKFNKQDLVKEAIASGDAIGSPVNGASEDAADPVQRDSEPTSATYSKSSSFFDNISSEAKDREDSSGKRLGGREFRNEERSKNFETFGQGSVDSYRGGFRGRGRGRGFRGRGYGRGGRGGFRGRGGPVAAEG